MKITNTLQGLLARFTLDQRGNVAMITGLLAIPMVGAVGAGIDYTRLVSYRLKTDSAATSASLAAIDTAHALLLANPNISRAELDAAARARGQQVFAGLAPPDTVGTTAFLRLGDTLSAKVDFTGSLPTTFMGVLGMRTLNTTGASNSTGQIGAMPGVTDPSMLVQEDFNVNGVTPTIDNGSWGVYADFNNWKTNEAGIEIGRASVYGEKPPNNASHVVELDGYQSTYMARKIYLTPGTYELRYYYKDRIVNAEYAPAFICGASSADLAWTESTTSPQKQTNAISVFFELANSDVPPAVFSADQHSEVDACVLSSGKWIERSVMITTYSVGFYWLAFQAKGDSDGLGGLLTGIRLCKTRCPWNPMEAYPWTANQLLFKDDFTEITVPSVSVNPPNTPPPGNYGWWTNGTLNKFGQNTGWPRLPTGWTTAPFNQMDFNTALVSPLGGNSVDIDASSGNRAVSRKFILTPGYYRIDWTYAGRTVFADLGSQVICGPGSGNDPRLSGTAASTNSPLLSAFLPLHPGWHARNTNTTSVYLDADRLVSHPNHGEEFYAPSTYKNPDGSAATLPQLPQNWIDTCGYAPNWLTRSINVRISKTGLYWLTFRGEGASDSTGGQLANFRMFATGPLSMTAPANVVNIPIGGIVPGSTIRKPHLEFVVP